jgi:DHA2 family multidrug resistance protein
MMIPITMATIYELFEPEERGQAIGIWGVAVMAAPALGPVLGGTVVSQIGWRWLFLINIPIGFVAIPLSVRMLRERHGGEPRRLDSAGLVAAAAGIVLLLVGLAQGGTDGFGNPSAFVPLVLSAVVIVGFVLHSLRIEWPVIDLRILTQTVFSRSIFVLVLVFAAGYARLVYVPLELGSTRSISAFTIGLVLLPQAIGTAITMPIGGRLTDRIGARVPVVVGIAVFAGSFWPLAHLTSHTSLVWVAFWLFVGGLGSGLGMMPPNVVAMNSVPTSKVSQGTAISQVLRQLGASVFTAILAAILAATRPAGDPHQHVHAAVDAYDVVFLVVFITAAVSCLLAFRLPGKREALALQAERRQERSLLGTIGELQTAEGGLAAEML